MDSDGSTDVFDLETAFELVTLEIERCHYLSRRAELERNGVYTADELDLLTVYLKNRFNIGEDEHDGSHLTWYGESRRLTPVPDDRRGMQLVAPPSTTTPFWTKPLAALEEGDLPAGQALVIGCLTSMSLTSDGSSG